jgi:hypothetical protein
MRERTSLERELQDLGLHQEYETPPALSGDQVARAIRANRRYGASLGWQADHDRIVRLLGYSNQTPDEQRFAESVALWQRRTGLSADGVIGPRTWARIRASLGGMPAAPAQAGTATGPSGPFDTIALDRPGKPPFRYTFTPEDALWTARFITGEAGGKDTPENQAVISTMFNRYALFTHPYYPTFHQFIRAYSTPLQPVLKSWGASKRHKADFVRTGGFHKPPHANIPKGQLGKFLALQRRPWSKLPAGARALALRALRGKMPNLVGNATEFGSTRVYFYDRHGRYPNDEEWLRFTMAYARGKKWSWIGDVQGLDQRGNTFFVDNRISNLPSPAVQVMPPQ